MTKNLFAILLAFALFVPPAQAKSHPVLRTITKYVMLPVYVGGGFVVGHVVGPWIGAGCGLSMWTAEYVIYVAPSDENQK